MLSLVDRVFKAIIITVFHEERVSILETNENKEILRRKIATMKKNWMEILEWKNKVTEILKIHWMGL